MRPIDVRRLTGRNFLTAVTGAAVELVFDTLLPAQAADRSQDVAVVDAMVVALQHEVDAVFALVGLNDTQLTVRRHNTGMSVAVAAPRDVLAAAADALELAALRACEACAGRPLLPLEQEPLLPLVIEALKADRSPPLLAFMAAASRRALPLLIDEQGVTVGQGRYGRTWQYAPSATRVQWEGLSRIPVAVVTGTNGKTTTTRFLAAMVRAAGHVVGHTSTDGVVIADSVAYAGDWSGPGGARLVLRDDRVEMAVLETARGGLLRRGLAVVDYDVGVITNVSADHLGEYGVHDVAAMADVKALVGHGVRREGTVVLNADDDLLVARSGSFSAAVVMFSLTLSPAFAAHLHSGATGWCLEQDALWRISGGVRHRLLSTSEIPLAFDGAAPHNVGNALAAAAAGHALGLNDDAVAAGLRGLLPTARDTPGRSQVLQHLGVRLVLDFAHNRASIEATLAFINALRRRDEGGGRLVVITGSAGDRSDDEIRAVVGAVHAGGADVVVVRELPKYLRGRAAGEVPTLMHAELRRLGMSQHAVIVGADDVAALTLALDSARPGDTIALLVQVDAPGVTTLLSSRGWLVS